MSLRLKKTCSAHHREKSQGFSLVELVLVIILIGILATMTLTTFTGGEDARKFEITRQKMDAIRQAILGTDAIDSQGRRVSFGYHGDIGHLPVTLDSLTSSHTPAWAYNATYGFGAGWRGPYYHVNFDDAYPITTDAWGRAFVYSTSASPPSLTSYGADGASGGTVYNQDLTMTFDTNARFATVRGVVHDRGDGISGKTAQIYYPVDGTITAFSTTSDSNGRFLFYGVPYGVRAAEITNPPPTRGVKSFVVDKPETMIPAEAFNYFGSLQRVTVTTAGCNAGKQVINVASSYTNTLTADYMTFWWENTPSRTLNTIKLNSVSQAASKAATGTRVDITNALTIPSNTTVPLELWWSGSMNSREVSGALEWNSRSDKDSIAWKTAKCIAPITLNSIGYNSSSAHGSSSITLPYTVPSGLESPVLVVVACGQADSKSVEPSSATFPDGGTTMKKYEGTDSSGKNADTGGALFYNTVTSGAAGNVSISWGATMDHRTVQAVTLDPASTDDPEDGDKADNDSKSVSITLKASDVERMIMTVGCNGTNSALSATGGNHTIQNTRTVDTLVGSLGSLYASTAGNYPAGYTAGSINRLIEVGAVFKPVE